MAACSSCCRVCRVSHDPEIHEATLRIHNWLRARMHLITECRYEEILAEEMEPEPGVVQRL